MKKCTGEGKKKRHCHSNGVSDNENASSFVFKRMNAKMQTFYFSVCTFKYYLARGKNHVFDFCLFARQMSYLLY